MGCTSGEIFIFIIFFQKLPRAVCKEKENLVHSADTFIVQSMIFEAFLSCLPIHCAQPPYSTPINCRSLPIFSISNHLTPNHTFHPKTNKSHSYIKHGSPRQSRPWPFPHHRHPRALAPRYWLGLAQISQASEPEPSRFGRANRNGVV